MDIQYGKLEQKNIEPVAPSQVRVPVTLELQVAAKKVLGVTASCFVNGVERTEKEVRVSGKVKTRVIFIDETNGFNSEEREDAFSEKFAPKNLESFISFNPIATLVQSDKLKHHKNDTDFVTSIQTEHVVTVGLTALTKSEITYVADIRGDKIESMTDTMKVSTWGASFFERFEIGESFALEPSVEGVLGTDIACHVREILVNDDRFIVKGSATVGIAVVKSVESGQTIQNTWHEFDFSKTFNKKDITMNDTIVGSVFVSSVTAKVEGGQSPSLVVEAEVVFAGHSVTEHELKIMKDAFCCDHELAMQTATMSDTRASAQVNMMSDIEGNVNMPSGAPFIGKVLMCALPTLGTINVKPQDDKVIVEGVLNAAIVYECDERIVHDHNVEVPFSVTAKLDGCTPGHNVSCSLVPLSCNVKARRGKELLVDARIGVSASIMSIDARTVTSAVTKGALKGNNDHAILIHVVSSGEKLWDIAKRVSIPTAEILRQNPSVEQGVNDGDRVVMYKRSV
jgi:LysM repeat protein